jgi:hypothetical protein
MKECNICRGTGKIELFASVVDCDCVKSLNKDKTEARDAIRELEQAIRDGLYKVCEDCHQARNGEPCIKCHRWVCDWCMTGLICKQCYPKVFPLGAY